MPTINEYEVIADAVCKGDELWLPRAAKWAAVTGKKLLPVNVDILTESGAVRFRRDHMAKIRRSEYTLHEKVEQVADMLDREITKWLPEDDALEVLRTEAAAKMQERGPIDFLTWNAADYAKAEHELRFRIGVRKHLEHAMKESVGKWSTLDIARFIIEALDHLKEEMVSWYIPRSTSGGSNLAEFAEWDAWKDLTATFGGLSIKHTMLQLEKLQQQQAETASS